MDIEKKLQTLQEINAPDSLRKRIHGLTHVLPTNRRGFYFPLFAMQHAVAFAVLLLVVGIGGGFVASVSFAQPQTPLYPVRMAVQQVLPRRVSSPSAVITAKKVPTPLITPIDMQKVTPQDKEDKHALPEGSMQNNTQSDNQFDHGKKTIENILHSLEEKFQKKEDSGDHGDSHNKD